MNAMADFIAFKWANQYNHKFDDEDFFVDKVRKVNIGHESVDLKLSREEFNRLLAGYFSGNKRNLVRRSKAIEWVETCISGNFNRHDLYL
jgi:hypothetical protein